MDNVNDHQKQFGYATISIESGLWRIVWYNMHPGTGKLKRARSTFNLNRIADLGLRRRRANDMVNMVNAALDKGWNVFADEPLTAPVIAAPNKAMLPDKEYVSITAALAKALRIKVLGKADRTVSSYGSFVRRFTAYLASIEIDAMPLKDFTTEHYQDYLFYKENLGHGNKNLNETTLFLRSLFEICRKQLKLIPDNPLNDIEALPEAESNKFLPLTMEEIQKIVPALIAHNPRYYLYVRFIPDEYIRPHHIARLKAGDINYCTDEISLSGDTTKNKRRATKQLMKGLKDALLEMDYHKIPGNHYLFTGVNFMPGPTLYPRLSVRAAEIWKEIVIDGLRINKQMYALKHTSAQYFVNNNDKVDIYYLRQQMEHSSAQQTEIYLQRNTKKKVKESEVKTLKF